MQFKLDEQTEISRCGDKEGFQGYNVSELDNTTECTALFVKLTAIIKPDDRNREQLLFKVLKDEEIISQLTVG